MIQFILCGVEGTTTPAHFVNQVLFPYVEDNLAAFIRDHHEDPEILAQLHLIYQQMGVKDDVEAAIAQIADWQQEEKKDASLQYLEEMVWRYGYESGEFQAPVFEDVPIAFQRWTEAGLQLGVYSAGSTDAEQMLFIHSDKGDLSHYLDEWFDGNIGPTQDPDSYRQIRKELGLKGKEILFLSDEPSQLNAASKAGFNTIQMVRPGTEPCENHISVESFTEILV